MAQYAIVIDNKCSSGIQLPSSPPKRQNTQSARRNLMKRPSIYDPRVPLLNGHRQLERPIPNVTAESDQHTRPSLMMRLPVDTHVVPDRVPAKRKCVEDALTQRVTRPKLVDERPAAKNPVVPVAKTKNIVEKTAFTQPAPMVFSDDAPAPPSPTCKTYSKQRPAVINQTSKQHPKPAQANQSSLSRWQQHQLCLSPKLSNRVRPSASPGQSGKPQFNSKPQSKPSLAVRRRPLLLRRGNLKDLDSRPEHARRVVHVTRSVIERTQTVDVV